MIHVMKQFLFLQSKIERNDSINCLTGCLKIIEIESVVAKTSPRRRGHELILIVGLFSCRQRIKYSLIAVKVNPDFERGGEAAGGGVGRAGGGGGPEGAADPRHPGDGGGGGGRGLQSGDLEIISETFLTCLRAAEGGHPGALGPDIGFLCGVIRRGSDTIRGRDGGGGDDRTVAD